ncbi:Hypothetical protein ADU72_1911 [Pediococcus damnosus]|uniref:Uncharacterized protein n=1 Tax=Pediococcus damnosus TaxID=51663 RepID=A0A0R2HVI3_9LACO|nr:hypothetical protein [Pediococcus damnosus]AMV61336.1 Hypothetical protein ADU69_1689 [Pediococcus damnosus]AMV62310.1 Hypothetical protein ADU70_0812 [Pediococcus damnosus]AMV65695.1 Hypothetical protein ADU71_1809 [Pediococcus damnosus]AMV67832.1 Hypothetical protein ADU72_1911 [Pediococcus damnosus]AMV70036.1 Hypothetical protein ADU73_1646 [Pediococcus damnosus]
MAKKNKHHFLKFTLLSFLGFHGGKYVLSHPHLLKSIQQDFKDTINSIHEFSQAITNLKTSTTSLQSAIKASEPTIEAIQKDIDHFQYKLQPRLSKINGLTEDIDKQINQISNKNPKK